MEKINVVICVPTLSLGGAETMSTQLAQYVDTNKFNVHFIVNHSKVENRNYFALTSNENIHLYFLDENKGISVRSIVKMYKLLKKIKPDIIHTHLHSYPYVMLYAINHKVKILHTIHNMPEFESKKSGQKILRFLFKHKYAYPVGISNVISTQTDAFYKLKDTVTIYNPVNVGKFNKVGKKDSNVFTFISTGRMSKQKNQKLLISAFAKVSSKHKNVRLLIAGDGVLKDELLAQVKELNLSNVTFLGNINNVEDYYAISNAFILSSIYEGLPMTILEAMAAHLPIISTDVGGVKDIVTDNGLLTTSENEDELVDAMCKLVTDRKLCDELGEKSFKNVQQFDISVITKKYEDLYCKYAKKKKVK